MNIHAVFLGIQPGFKNQPAIELYTLLAPVGHHPTGSTVSRKTLEDHGYLLPRFPQSEANPQELSRRAS
jgi:hypothetical protein